MATNKTALRRGVILMVLCAVGWSLSGIFIKIIDWNPLVIAGFRSLFAGITTAIFMLVCKIKPIVNKKTVFGGIMMTLVFFLFVVANKLTTAANAIALQYTEPVFLMIFSAVFLGQKFRRHDILAALLTFFGIALFFFDEISVGNMLGNFLAILAGVALAFLFMTVGAVSQNERTSTLLIGNIITAVVGIAFLIRYPITDISIAPIVNIVFLGVIQLGIPYILFTLAAKDCPVFLCSLIAMLEPLLNPVWVFIFNGETPGTFAIIGGIVVVVTVTAYSLYDGYLNQKSEAHV